MLQLAAMEARAKEMAGNEEQLRRLKEEGDRLAAEAKQRQEELEKVRRAPGLRLCRLLSNCIPRFITRHRCCHRFPLCRS